MIPLALAERFDLVCKSRIEGIEGAVAELHEKTTDFEFPLLGEWLHFEIRAQIEQLEAADILALKRLQAAVNLTGVNTEEADFKECRACLTLSHPAHLSFGGLNEHFGPVGSPFPDQLEPEEFYRVRKFLRNLAFTHWHLLNQTDTFSPPFQIRLKESSAILLTALNKLSWLTEIFISYARGNAAAVQAIRAKIEKSLNSYFVYLWQDTQRREPGQLGTEGIRKGSLWKDDLEERLQTRDLALLMLSPEFAGSTVIQDMELAELLKRHQPERRVWLLPVRLNECKCEALLKSMDWFPADSYLLHGALDGLPTEQMLARCEKELVSEILAGMADAADAGSGYNFLKTKLEELHLAGGSTTETPLTRTPSGPESSAPLRR